MAKKPRQLMEEAIMLATDRIWNLIASETDPIKLEALTASVERLARAAREVSRK